MARASISFRIGVAQWQPENRFQALLELLALPGRDEKERLGRFFVVFFVLAAEPHQRGSDQDEGSPRTAGSKGPSGAPNRRFRIPHIVDIELLF